MRFYTRQHRHYCGIDLHVKTMYVCILDGTGQVLVHRNLKATPDALLEAVAPYRDDLVVAVECMFTRCWLADLCAEHGIPFVLGHALAMKAIHGGKPRTTGSTRTRSRRGARRPSAAGVRLSGRHHEIHDVTRFDRVQAFASYARLVKCAHESAGKKYGTGGAKMGNVHVKWAFSEAAVLFLRHTVAMNPGPAVGALSIPT